MPSVAEVSLNEDTKNHSVYSRARLWAAKGGNMSEKDSEGRVTLADIEKEIKSMRKEAGMQYKHTLYFNAYAIACAVCPLRGKHLHYDASKPLLASNRWNGRRMHWYGLCSIPLVETEKTQGKTN